MRKSREVDPKSKFLQLPRLYTKLTASLFKEGIGSARPGLGLSLGERKPARIRLSIPSGFG